MSLDPPLIAIFPSLTSTSWRAIAPQRSFGVNVLAVEQRDLSGHFGRSQPDKFAGIDWHASEGGSPFLGGAVMSLDCEIEDEYPGGDHVVVLGRVRNIRLDETKKPLVFHAGAYASVGAEPQQ